MMPQRFFSNEKVAQAFVLCEVLLVFLIAYLFYKVMGLEIGSIDVSFTQNIFLMQDLVWLIASVSLLLAVYFGIAVRDLFVTRMHKEFALVIKQELSFKVECLNKQVILLWMVELIIAVIIGFSIYVYLDPEINILPSTTPWFFKLIGFCALLLFALYIFTRTKLFREMFYGPSLVRQVIRPKNKHVQMTTQRITNPKTGSIRIASKRRYLALKYARLRSKKRKK